jgi:hypothetical protein
MTEAIVAVAFIVGLLIGYWCGWTDLRIKKRKK